MPELAVLVPVLDRPANVLPLVWSYVEGCPADSELLFVANGSDKAEYQAIRDAVWEVDPEDGLYGRVMTLTVKQAEVSWPKKINAGAKEAMNVDDAEWLLFAADDIAFQPGWWEATAELRADPTVGVIGTNDSLTGTGNQAVAEGSHTCHPLVRAEYIRTQGTWDGPGRAVSDEYHHWYVDNELVVTAKQRRAWAFCREAVLEHLHPYWHPDTVQWDATYALGESRNEEDRQTWFRRAAANGPL